ncbi:MAG: ribosomal subunit interface protein [Candidatus Harrisonbacteria bacterium CG10_big_fil_rev_8_21_14_0_10_42_17]|uniref:Ribosomal subunit interface protein n=1 Tax=Candidatus Harrisonbacteria bacterium CG10_big_fil_rev_8_21_14_0_10_42_17 TaxID=1974584 RepID=A0A2M6WHD3_9BACT|nr:MAG: ribosomal subunit interface protein [Candidatus Harrisonbacteria bacterium CG10_big_fil_rev_8_21_14_0_10_42_17]
MNIAIKTSIIDLTPALKEYVDLKLSSLEKLVSRWEVETEISLWVELDRTTLHHHKGNVFRAVLSLHLPNTVLRAEEERLDIRKAIDASKIILKQEIQRYKEIASDHL